jgi:hypothetical protein
MAIWLFESGIENRVIKEEESRQHHWMGEKFILKQWPYCNYHYKNLNDWQRKPMGELLTGGWEKIAGDNS